MKRVSVVGSSGAGKTTLARRLADAIDAPHVELDALFWGAGWTQATADELAARVVEATGADAWVVDGNYQSKVGTLVWNRADTVVWIDASRWRSMSQVVGRTVRRIATRQELWNGNRESWQGLCFWRGEDSILWWAWTSHARVRERYLEAMTQASSSGPEWHRLRTRRDVARFLATQCEA
ncbi:hypothetical protein F0U44_11175 [Nocardioides humilatus]|uniref:Adenylate kinase n=1 Tax=Nocardioides humilatus TaxID=2607660 RepID=A0A5B1LHB9_9ACTN|nr:hypothetical protein [Nocardioides humilatus]KAA1419017.1 hypothetical protein F0U44_11175 [Nocardioides humilatus]